MKVVNHKTWTNLIALAAAATMGASTFGQLSVVRQHTGTTSNERFGHALALLDDLDNDGVRDYAIGTALGAWAQSTDGYVQIFSGATGLQIPSPAMFGDGAGDQFGYAITNLPDITGDGIDEFAVGAPGDGTNGSAYVRVFSGSTMLALYTIYAPFGQPDSRFGFSLCTADMTGNGVHDLVVGAPFWDPGTGLSNGSVFVFNSLTQAILDQSLGWANSNLGWSVSNIGDIGNGAHSIVAGAPELSFGLSGGGFRVLKGDPLFAISDLVDFYATADDNVGIAVTGVELEPQNTTAGFVVGSLDSNTVQFYTVDPVTAVLTPGFTVSGRPGSDRFGAVLAPAGDVNGDGFDDVAVGSPPSGSDLGYVRTLSGSTGTKLNTYYGKRSADDGHGEAISSAGDFDGDGDDDLLVGAPTWESSQTASNVGRVVLVDL